MQFKKYPTKYRKNLDLMCSFDGFANENYFLVVKEFIPSSLRRIGPADTLEKQINCHGYTFEIYSWYPSEKVEKSIVAGLLREINRPLKGGIILYYLEGKIKHSGIYLGKGKVKSKWSNGPVFKHNVFNVPLSYGDKVKLYRKKEQGD